MSKACHTREAVPILPPEGLAFWKASAYRVEGASVAAVPEATWKHASPGAFYRTTGKRRELNAGPHVHFLTLRAAVKQGRADLYEPLRKRFVNDYGLLGMFNETYELAPVLPDGKLYIAPSGVISADGQLRRVDPATEGLEMVLEVLACQYPDRWRPELAATARRKVALPSEVGLIPRSYAGPWKETAHMLGPPVPWTEAHEPYGALFVLDSASSTRVTVLSTREPLELLITVERAKKDDPLVAASGWETALLNFPTGPYNPGDRSLVRDLNARLSGVSPYMPEDVEDFRRGWRCRSLLEAMALMLWLDLTGGSSIRECASHDCSNYFRLGSQEGSLYCSVAHASRASTRLSRGKQP